MNLANSFRAHTRPKPPEHPAPSACPQRKAMLRTRRLLGLPKSTESHSQWLHVLASLGVAIATLPSTSSAQSIWSNPVTGVFSSAGNWANGAVPASSASTALSFTHIDSYVFTPRNDLGTFSLNSVTLSNYSTINSSSTVAVSNSPGGSLSFEGASPTVNFDGWNHTLGSVSVSTSPGVRFSPTSGTATISGRGWGTLTLATGFSNANPLVTGTGGLTINLTSPTAVVASASNNTLSGGINLISGGLQFGSSNAFGGATNTITVSGPGYIRAGSSVTVPNPFVLSSDLRVAETSNAMVTFGGVMSGTSGLRVGAGSPWVAGRSSVSLLAVNTFSGPVNIIGTPVHIEDNTALYSNTLSLDAASSILNVPSITVGYNGSLILTGAASNRIADTATLVLSSGTLAATTASGTLSETVGATTITGQAVFSSAGTGVTSLQLASLSRDSGNTSTVLFRGTFPVRSGASTASGLGTFTATGGLPGVAPYAVASDTQSTPLIPWALGLTGTGKRPNTVVVYNTNSALGATGINLIDPSNTTFFQTLTFDGASPVAYTASGSTLTNITNRNLNLFRTNARSASLRPGLTVTPSGLTVSALTLTGSSSATVVSGSGVQLVGSGDINVSSGLVANLMGEGTGYYALAGLYVNGPSVNFGATRGYIHLAGNIFFNYLPGSSTGTGLQPTSSTIKGSGGVVVSGPIDPSYGGSGGTGLYVLQLTGSSPNTFTGGLGVNGGASVFFTDDDKLGAPNEPITLNGGTLAAGIADNNFPGTFFNVQVPRTVTVGASGGALLAWDINTYFNVSGQITGPGSLAISSTNFSVAPGAASGIVLLTGNNDYAGTTDVLMYAKLRISSDANVGTGDITLNNSTLTFVGSTLSKSIRNYGSALLDNDGSAITYAGQIATYNTVVMPNFYFSGFGSTAITTPQSRLFGAVYANTALSLSGGGSLPGASQIIVSSGSSLTLDNTAGNSADRVHDSALINLAGGATLALVGNDAGNTSENIGSLLSTNTSSGSSNNVSVVNGAGRQSTLTTSRLLGGTPLVKTGTGTLAIAGDPVTLSSTFSSLLLIDAGTVQVGASPSLAAGSIGSATVALTGTLRFNRGGTLVAPNSISGSGALEQTGLGTVTLSGSLTYSGPTRVTAGQLTLDSPLAPANGVGGDAVVTGSSVLQISPSASASTYTTAAAFNSLTIGTPGQTPVSVVRFASTTRTGSSAVAASVIVTSSLSLASTGSNAYAGYLDLGNNDLIIRGGASQLGTLQQYFTRFLASPTNSRFGLGSSVISPTTGAFTTLAIFSNSFDSQPYFGSYDGITDLTADDVIVKFTYVGDTNLDGILDGQDYKNVMEGFNLKLTGWYYGDVDNSGGIVSSADVTAFLAAYSYFNNPANQAPSYGAGQELDAASSKPIPEPHAVLSVLPLAGLGMRRRRTRN